MVWSSGEPDMHLWVHVDASGIVRLRWAPGVEITEELAQAAMAAVVDLNAGRPRPLFVDMTGAGGITRGARRVFTRFTGATRLALFGRSAVDRVLVNFALSVSALAVPVRFFTSEGAASRWLCDDCAAA